MFTSTGVWRPKNLLSLDMELHVVEPPNWVQGNKHRFSARVDML